MPGEPVHGVDYLIDYYALLGVPRGASKEEVNAAFRALQKQYHPDRYEGLAPELKARAAHQSRLINEAKELLDDDARRPEYDARLASWKKPISTRGEIVIDLESEHFSFGNLIGHLGDDPEVREREAERLALTFSGFEKATYDFFRAQAAQEGGLPEALRAAYAEQLGRRDLYLSLKEGFAWDDIGLRNRGTVPSLEYQAQAAQKLEEVAQEIASALLDEGKLLAAGVQNLLAPPPKEGGGVPAVNDSIQALALTKRKLDERLVAGEAKIRDIAKERESLINEQFLINARISYHPDTKVYTRKLLLEILSEKTVRLFVRYEGDGATVTDPPEEASSLDPGALMERGYTLLTFNAVEGIEFMSQLQRVIDMHEAKVKSAEGLVQ